MCLCTGIVEVGVVAAIAGASAYYKKCKCKIKTEKKK